MVTLIMLNNNEDFMAVLLTPPVLQFFGSDGVTPLAAGKIYTYAAGTTTNKATYTTSAANVEKANPVILDSVGKAEIWISGSYKFVVKDSSDVTISTTDNVTSFTALPAVSTAYFQSFSGTGSQTAFTASDDLGTDEKAIYVWVDAGAGDAEGYVIQNPSAYTIAGTTLTFSVAPASGSNNIYVSAPSLLVGAASSSAADAAASATAAAVSEAQAGAYAGQLEIESTTSLAIGTGTKAFTVASGLSLSAGQFILAASDASPTVNYMWGSIASYSGTTLTVTVEAVGGSGTKSDWTAYLTGERGTTGATGSISDLSGVPSGTIAAADNLIFEDENDSNTTKSTTLTLLAEAVGNLLLPVGSYYINETVSTNPATLLGFGTWTAVEDTFLVGYGSTYTGTGGAATDSITLSVSNMPAHKHSALKNSTGYYGNTGFTGASSSTLNAVTLGSGTGEPIGETETVGSGTSFNVDTIPPYQAAYIWKRTA